MKFTSVILSSFPVLAMAMPAPVAAPDHVSVDNIAYGGTGCPQGSADVTVTPTSLGLEFRNFTAAIGSSYPITESRKNCQLNVGVVAPAGFRWTLKKDQYRGWVDLDPGVNVNMRTNVYFSGSQDQSTGFTATISGPQTGAFQVDEYPQSTPWSPCGGESAININLQVFLRKTSTAASGSKGVAVTKDLNVTFKQVFDFDWDSC